MGNYRIYEKPGGVWNAIFLLAILISTSFCGFAENGNNDVYPASYAKAPRFNALLYYSDTAEPAHVDFARPPQPALLDTETSDNPVTKNLPASFVAPECEWYQWNPSPRKNPDVEVLLSLSPRNYPIGIKDVVFSGDFPVVWTNTRYRMIYLNIGHGDTEFSDPVQNLLIVNSFRWVVSRSPKGDPFR